MIPFDVVLVVPSTEGTPSRQARESLARLDAMGRAREHVLALTLFIDSVSRAEYEGQRECLLGVVSEHYGDAGMPPVSVVAQAPAGGAHVALEAAVLAAPAGVRLARREGCTVAEHSGVRQVHAGGLCSNGGLSATAEQARDAFAKMEAVLARESLTFQHVVRQWNYIEGMLDVREVDGKEQQGYQAFNDVRTLAYGPAPWSAGYPAGTGIGQAAGGVQIEFLAIDAPGQVRVVPLSNPHQTDAHDYSEGQLVGESLEELPGKSTPKFERAKLVARGDSEVVFVSGTAAILGERSVGLGDVAVQTRTTIDNISALIGGRPLSRLRAYVKRDEDIPAVRSICEEAYGPIPALYVRADVCREELLVELEGAVVA